MKPEAAWNRLVVDTFGKDVCKIHHKESFPIGVCGVFTIGYGFKTLE